MRRVISFRSNIDGAAEVSPSGAPPDRRGFVYEHSTSEGGCKIESAQGGRPSVQSTSIGTYLRGISHFGGRGRVSSDVLGAFTEGHGVDSKKVQHDRRF